MNIREFYNFIESNHIDLDYEFCIFAKYNDDSLISIDKVDYILRDCEAKKLIFISSFI